MSTKHVQTHYHGILKIKKTKYPYFFTEIKNNIFAKVVTFDRFGMTEGHSFRILRECKKEKSIIQRVIMFEISSFFKRCTWDMYLSLKKI